VGYSDHDRFRGYFPAHFIPAYNLPIYASQPPLRKTRLRTHMAASLGGSARVVGAGRGCGDDASADYLFIVSAFKSPAVVAGLDDVAVMGQSGGLN
jgi:hypothetical protein